MAALVLAAGPARAFESVDALVAVLETNGVACDRTRALQAAFEATLRSVDPGARWVSPAEAESLRAQGAVVSAASDGPGATNRVCLQAVELWAEGLAYLKVGSLTPGSGEQLSLPLRTLDDRSGVVLDLRGADGVDVGAVVALASPFRCPGEPLFSVEDVRGQALQSCVATSAPSFHAPLMVLTDPETRGAAELLAACLRGVPGVMLIGSRTGGEARLRDLLPTPDGRFILVAARRLAPADRPSFEACGVEPDLVVAVSDPGGRVPDKSPPHGRTPSAKTVQDHELILRMSHDAVLRRAVDILLGLKALDYAHS